MSKKCKCTPESCGCASSGRRRQRVPSVGIVGAGFAGLRAVRALRGVKCKITVFDPRTETAMLPALPDVAGGWLEPRLLTSPIGGLLPRGAEHVEARVSKIDLDAMSITAEEWTQQFDAILIAAGAEAVPAPYGEAAATAYTLDSVAGAMRLRKAFEEYLEERDGDAHLVIAGAGYTGLELAMSLSARARASGSVCRTTVVETGSQVLPFLPEGKRAYVMKALGDSGVEVVTEAQTSDWDGSSLKINGKRHEAVFHCWTVGSRFSVEELVGDVTQLRDGRLAVSQDLSLPGYPNVFVAGDAAAVSRAGAPVRKAVNFAWYGGYRAGRNVAARLRGRPVSGYRPIDLGWVIPLHTTGVGLIFGKLWVRGRLNLRMHYVMCGLRGFNVRNMLGFIKTALVLFKSKRGKR